MVRERGMLLICCLTSGRDIPHLERVVIRGRDDPFAIRTHCTTPDPAGMTSESKAMLSGGDIPHFERVIIRGRDDEAPIRTHCTVTDPAGMTSEGEALLSGGSIPHLGRGVPGNGDPPFAI